MPREKPLGTRTRTNNKLNWPLITLWKASALTSTSAPSLLPLTSTLSRLCQFILESKFLLNICVLRCDFARAPFKLECFSC